MSDKYYEKYHVQFYGVKIMSFFVIPVEKTHKKQWRLYVLGEKTLL